MSKLVDSVKNLPERLCPECKKKGLAIIKKGNRKGSMYWCPGCEKVKNDEFWARVSDEMHDEIIRAYKEWKEETNGTD